jgi:hypothetical protein
MFETREFLIGQKCVALHVKIEIGWRNDISNLCLLLRSVRRIEGHLSSISRVFVVKSRVCLTHIASMSQELSAH